MTFPLETINRNQLLSALPADEYLGIQNNLELVKMKRGDIIYKSGEPIKYVYFPETCIVLMTAPVSNRGLSVVRE